MSPHALGNRARTLQPTRPELESPFHALHNAWKLEVAMQKFCPNRLPTLNLSKWTQISPCKFDSFHLSLIGCFRSQLDRLIHDFSLSPFVLTSEG